MSDDARQIIDRQWGEYTVLAKFPGAKVKMLTVAPGQALSTQQHAFRNEHWFVVSGTATVDIIEKLVNINGTKSYTMCLNRHDLYTIPVGQWHTLHNKADQDLVIIEIQYGEKCEEIDITRKSDK